MKIELPIWAQEEERPEWQLLLALLHRLGRAYGFKSTFLIYNEDLRIILGISQEEYYHITDAIEEQPWSRYLKVSKLLDGRTAIQSRYIRRDGAESLEATLSEQRELLIWMYLLGCFNNNLVELADHKGRKGLKHDIKMQLKNGDLL
jgi:hypothetical protein